MLIELLFAASLAGQDLYTQEECFRFNEVRGETQPWHEASCLTGWIYAPGVLETLDPFGRDAPRIFSAAARADIAAARARTPEGDLTPGLDADPFCNCQDPVGLFLIINTTRAPTDTEATSTVRFAFKPEGMSDEAFVQILTPDQVTERELVLVREPEGWRVDDIRSADGYSLRTSLQP